MTLFNDPLSHMVTGFPDNFAKRLYFKRRLNGNTTLK